MTTAIVAGPDVDGLVSELELAGVQVTRIEGVVTAEVLRDAGIDDADLYVLTDLDEATSIPVAKELHPDVRVVVYSRDSLPEFVRGSADIAMDPDLFAPDVVAEELA
ncbi:DUF7126 family protein [Salinirarus marinus]|uniref:DUF7126 family protein n=1 Tax=Salinirarus marinus TaxID=3068310 RepID=UPI003C6CABAE